MIWRAVAAFFVVLLLGCIANTAPFLPAGLIGGAAVVLVPVVLFAGRRHHAPRRRRSTPRRRRRH